MKIVGILFASMLAFSANATEGDKCAAKKKKAACEKVAECAWHADHKTCAAKEAPAPAAPAAEGATTTAPATEAAPAEPQK